jgi:hypothetical protein
MENTEPKVEERLVRVVAVPVRLDGNLSLPEKARGVVLFVRTRQRKQPAQPA